MHCCKLWKTCTQFLVSDTSIFIISGLQDFAIARSQIHMPTHTLCLYYTSPFRMIKSTVLDTLQMHVNISFHHYVASACSQQRSYAHLGCVAQCHRGCVSDSVYQLQRAFLRHTLFSVCAPSLIASALSRPAPYNASEQAQSLCFVFPLLITMVSHSTMSQNT